MIVQYLFGKLWIFIKISIFGIFDILIHTQKNQNVRNLIKFKIFWIIEKKSFSFMRITDFYQLSY